MVVLCGVPLPTCVAFAGSFSLVLQVGFARRRKTAGKEEIEWNEIEKATVRLKRKCLPKEKEKQGEWA